MSQIIPLSDIDRTVPPCYISFVFIVKDIETDRVKSALSKLISASDNYLSSQLVRNWSTGNLYLQRNNNFDFESCVDIQPLRSYNLPLDDLKIDNSKHLDLEQLLIIPTTHESFPKSLVKDLWPSPENSSGIFVAPLIHVNIVPLEFISSTDNSTTAVSLGIQAHHTLFDMFGFYKFVKILAETIRTGSIPHNEICLNRLASLFGNKKSQDNISEIPQGFSDSIIMKVPIEPFLSPLDAMSPSDRAVALKQFLPPSISVIVRFRKSLIDKWRNNIVKIGESLQNSEDNKDIIDSKLSTNSIVCAVLWNAVQKILPDSDEPSVLGIPVNIRRFLTEKDAEKYMGNTVLIVGVKDISEKSNERFANLRNSARKISSAIRKLDSEKSVEKCISWLADLNSKKLSVITPFTTGIFRNRKDIGITNWSKLSFNSIDFGSNLLLAMPDCAVTLPGIISLIDSNDGVNAFIGAGADQKDRLISDEFINEALNYN